MLGGQIGLIHVVLLPITGRQAFDREMP